MLSKLYRSGLALIAIGSLLSAGSCHSENKEVAVQANTQTTSDSANASAPIDSSSALPVGGVLTTENEKVSDAVASKAETHVVTINNMKFNPATITVKKGDKVTFINNDIVQHNATEKGTSWASPLLANGQSWTFTPEKTSDYYCTVHVVMKGKIIVE